VVLPLPRRIVTNPSKIGPIMFPNPASQPEMVTTASRGVAIVPDGASLAAQVAALGPNGEEIGHDARANALKNVTVGRWRVDAICDL
jgi:hypothetical protein